MVFVGAPGLAGPVFVSEDGPPLRCVAHDRVLTLADVFDVEVLGGEIVGAVCVRHAAAGQGRVCVGRPAGRRRRVTRR